MREFTVELTNFCPHHCSYCSSNSVDVYEKAHFLTVDEVLHALDVEKCWDVIHLSGGEPMAHPQFYWILQLCQQRAKRVIVHTNAIQDIAFNPNVIDGVYVEAYLNVPETADMVHVLKRVDQGREAKRPKMHASCNWTQECHECGHHVLRYDGVLVESPCKKFTEVEDCG